MTNVGEKIKALVVVVAILGLLSCLILFFVGNAAYQEDREYIKYATVNGGAYGYSSLQAAGDSAYNGLQLRRTSIYLALTIAIGSVPLYGYGVLVENSETQADRMYKLLEEQKKTNAALNSLLDTINNTPIASKGTPVSTTSTASSYTNLPEL